jgi:hypothetical protein
MDMRYSITVDMQYSAIPDVWRMDVASPARQGGAEALTESADADPLGIIVQNALHPNSLHNRLELRRTHA